MSQTHQGTPDITSREHTRYWAEFWEVTMRTVQRWKRDRLPVDNVDAMMKWSLGRMALPEGFRRKVDEIRLRRQREPGSRGYDLPGISESPPQEAPATPPAPRRFEVGHGEGLDPDPDYQEFLKQAGATERGSELEELEHWRDFYNFKLRKAAQAGDRAEVKFCEDRVINFSEAIRKQRLLAARLGLDSGDLLAKDTVDQLVRAIASRLNAGIRILINDLPERLVGLTFPEEIADRLEDGLLTHGLLLPFSKAAGQASGIGIPKWVVEIMRDAIDDHLEHGDKEFDEAVQVHG